MEYSVGGNGDNVIKSDNYKLNLYYNPSKRGEKICDIQHAVSEQSAELDIMIRTKEPVADREDTIKRFNLLDITFNDDDTIKSYGVNQKKLDTTVSGHGPREAREEGCSSTLWASSRLRTYAPYGRVMKCSARSLHRQKQSLPRGRPAKSKIENQEL